MDYAKISLLVADSINDLVYVSDVDTYELLYLNKNTVSAFSEHDKNFKWKNEKCYKVLQNKEAPCEFCTNKILSKDSFHEWNYFNPITKQYYLLKDKLIEFDNKLVRMEIAINSTEQYVLTKHLEEQLLEQQVLHNCIETMHSNATPKEAILKLLEILGKHYLAERSYIFTISKELNIVSNEFEWTDGKSLASKDDLTNTDATPFKRWIDTFKTCDELIMLDVNHSNIPIEEYNMLSKYNVSNLLAVPLRDSNGNLEGFIGVDNPTDFIDKTQVFKDLSFFISSYFEKNQILTKLNTLSFHDINSGLKNRNAYSEHIKSFNYKTPDTLGVIVLDIKALRLINDLHGYEYGDQVILTLASLLTKIFNCETIYRLGGDDFVVLCENLSEDFFENLIEKFQNELKSYSFEVNFGYAFNKIYGISNVNSKSCYIFQSASYTNLLIENLLREIEDGKFTVFLQPQIDIKTNTVIGAEALIRKYDSKGNIKPPSTFLPFYEKESIIPHLDLFVFETICKFLNELQRKSCKHNLRMSINFSRKTLTDSNIVGTLLELCCKYDVSPSNFIIEITETVTGINDLHLIHLVTEFNNTGFLVSLDDFGSGYSNLSILSKVNFHEIKIDKTIVDEYLTNEKSKIITEWSINLCKNFNNTTSVAEGIERKEQLEALKALGCDIGQGYYFSKPIPMQNFIEEYILT